MSRDSQGPRKTFSKGGSSDFNKKRSFSSSDKPKKDFKSGGSSFKKRDGDSTEKRSYTKREGGFEGGEKKSFGGDREKRPYAKREGSFGDREKKSFGGDREKRPYAKREGSFGDGEKKPYAKREGSFGDREKKSFGGDREKRPYAKREGSFGDGEKKPYAKREGSFGDREKRPYAKREGSFGDSERKPYAKREGGFGDGEKKPYTKRADGKYESSDRKSFGDSERKPYAKREGGYGDGEKRSYTKREGSFGDGEKKPYTKREDGKYESSDRKPYGDREKKPYGRREDSDRRPAERKLNPAEKVVIRSKKAGPKKTSTQQNVSDEAVRLNRYIANSGVCSRREADVLIATGVVTVNGKIITEMGYKVNPTDVVNYGGVPIKNETKKYLLLNKPKDYITTMDDPQERRTVMELINKACKERLYPVGRLDRNTTGVLLFTNDGDMTAKLTHPKFDVRKVYHVTLNRKITSEDYKTLSEGVELADGFIKPDAIEYVGAGKLELGVEIHSGKNRIVRRLFEHLNYEVVRLDRVIFAGLTKKDLPRGKFRFLTEKEVSFLKMLG